jgi:Zn-dependent protease
MVVDPTLVLGASILGLAVAVILHEVAHGYVALLLGDPTAKYAGRLTLNPIKHIDLWGTIIVPILMYIAAPGFMIGWAKPVPVNYYNLKYGKYGPFIVALAGPAANIIMMAVFGILVRFVPANTALPMLFYSMAYINGILLLFNLIPVPPLDGSKVLYLFLEKRPDIIMFLERYGFYFILALVFFGQGLLQAWIATPLTTLMHFFTGV